MDLLTALSLCATLTAAGCSSQSYKSEAEALLKIHNEERASAGCDPLKIDADLCVYAQKHAEKMNEKGHLVHSSMSDLAVVAGNGNVGENIAWGQDSTEEVCSSWMKSPGHRRNMLNKRFKRVGFGMKQDERGRKYWCVVFAG